MRMRVDSIMDWNMIILFYSVLFRPDLLYYITLCWLILVHSTLCNNILSINRIKWNSYCWAILRSAKHLSAVFSLLIPQIIMIMIVMIINTLLLAVSLLIPFLSVLSISAFMIPPAETSTSLWSLPTSLPLIIWSSAMILIRKTGSQN